jgi:hypothetical protein
MNDVKRAENALRTGQPNLAMLYMTRALKERVITFPDHLWDQDGKDGCRSCEPHTIWQRDRVAHHLGEAERGIRLMTAVTGNAVL